MTECNSGCYGVKRRRFRHGRGKLEASRTEVFVDRVTRKELKTDKFALEVGHTVSLFEEHPKEILRYGAIALVVIALGIGYWVHRGHEHAAVQEQLAQAILAQEAPFGKGTESVPGARHFDSEPEKQKVVAQEFTRIRTDHPGTTEAAISGYYLGASQADAGDLAQAEKTFRDVAEHGDARVASLAKLSLVQIYISSDRGPEAEKLLREMIDRPTIFVSKEQATISLARYLMKKNPAEARKLLDPLKSQTGGVSQEVITLLGQIATQ
jgi:predicted negative regulator of RcsB-dependent stress response